MSESINQIRIVQQLDGKVWILDVPKNQVSDMLQALEFERKHNLEQAHSMLVDYDMSKSSVMMETIINLLIRVKQKQELTTKLETAFQLQGSILINDENRSTYATTNTNKS